MEIVKFKGLKIVFNIAHINLIYNTVKYFYMAFKAA